MLTRLLCRRPRASFANNRVSCFRNAQLSKRRHDHLEADPCTIDAIVYDWYQLSSPSNFAFDANDISGTFHVAMVRWIRRSVINGLFLFLVLLGHALNGTIYQDANFQLILQNLSLILPILLKVE